MKDFALTLVFLFFALISAGIALIIWRLNFQIWRDLYLRWRNRKNSN